MMSEKEKHLRLDQKVVRCNVRQLLGAPERLRLARPGAYSG